MRFTESADSLEFSEWAKLLTHDPEISYVEEISRTGNSHRLLGLQVLAFHAIISKHPDSRKEAIYQLSQSSFLTDPSKQFMNQFVPYDLEKETRLLILQTLAFVATEDANPSVRIQALQALGKTEWIGWFTTNKMQSRRRAEHPSGNADRFYSLLAFCRNHAAGPGPPCSQHFHSAAGENENSKCIPSCPLANILSSGKKPFMIPALQFTRWLCFP